jgi:hypothetical protein
MGGRRTADVFAEAFDHVVFLADTVAKPIIDDWPFAVSLLLGKRFRS